MALLSSNPKKSRVAPVDKTQQPNSTKASKNRSSGWRVFKTKNSNKSSNLLNEEVNRVESRASPEARRSSSLSSIDNMEGKGKGNILLLSHEAIQELELQERSLPNRWLDFFCIVGLDPEATLVKDDGESSGENKNKPILLDRYPKEERLDMEFPVHLPTFCFPNGGCHPLRYKMRHHESEAVQKSPKKKGKNKKGKTNIKYHHNAPDPFLCNMVLTSGSGHRLYCTSLTVYEMREDNTPVEEEKPQEEKEEEIKEAEEPPPIPEFNKNWWEEPSPESTPEPVKKTKEKATPKVKEEYYWMVPKCLVLMSHYPFFQAQSIALKELFYTVQSGESPIPFERYVSHLVDDVPLPGSGIARQPKSQSHTVVEWMSWTTPLRKKVSKIPPTIRLERSPPNQLPLLNISMEPLFRTLSLSNILVIWAYLLQEGKVVLACSNSETAALLAPIAEALLALLFPLEWQGIYVPVLPNHDSVLDMLEAPVPYLIGLVTKPSDQQNFNPQSHPSGVLWCDLDNDALHLGFKGDRLFYNQNNQEREEIPLLPALPSEAAMTLKAELEEIADPLYLPTIEGIKGRITVGDRTVEMDNGLREPYAQRTKLFNEPIATPRKYILTQSSKIPPRGKQLKYEDFSIVAEKQSKNKTAVSPLVETKPEDDVKVCGLTLEDIQIPCGEDTECMEIVGVGQEEKKEDDIVKAERKEVDEEADLEEETEPAATNQESSTFLTTLKRQGRSVQAHVDRAMAVLGQDYATPSQYAKRQFGDDVLSRQDEIAAGFFSVDTQEMCNVTEKARESFLRFFLSTFTGYKTFYDSETGRFEEEHFLASLNLSYSQREYFKAVVTSQMFEIFLQDTRSIKNRKLFDEYAIKHQNGNFSIGGNKGLKRSYGTPLLDSSQWQNPTIVVPKQPCRVGVKEGRHYCSDRRFPDNLNPDECISNQSVSFWRMFCDGGLCSAFSSCS